MKVLSIIENLGVLATGAAILITLFLWGLYSSSTDSSWEKVENIDGYTYAEYDYSTKIWGSPEHVDDTVSKKIFSLHDILDYTTTDDYILIRKKNGRLKEESGILKSGDDINDETTEMFEYTHGSNVYYFILEKATCTVYGPYIYDEFVEKCNEMNIRIF